MLRHGHIEMIRMSIARKMNTSKMYAIWRIDAPWKPITRRGQGKRMGGGKGAIDHYVTPIKAERIIIEVAGKCSFEEVGRSGLCTFVDTVVKIWNAFEMRPLF